MTPSSPPSASARLTVLTVRLGEDLHGIPIDAIEEVLPALPIESVPGCPAFVRGVVFVRGHLIPVLDAAERLGIAGHTRPLEPQIVCVRESGRIVGVEVDEALDLVQIDPRNILPAAAAGAAGGLLHGLIDHQGDLIRVLDAAQLMDAAESGEVAQLAVAEASPGVAPAFHSF